MHLFELRRSSSSASVSSLSGKGWRERDTLASGGVQRVAVATLESNAAGERVVEKLGMRRVKDLGFVPPGGEGEGALGEGWRYWEITRGEFGELWVGEE